jgi:hypothetical protein
MALNPLTLPILKKGDRISAEHYAAVVRGMQEALMKEHPDGRKPEDNWKVVLYTEDIEPWSIFGITEATKTSSEQYFKVAKIEQPLVTPTGGLTILAVNEAQGYRSGTYGYAKIISAEHYGFVRFEGTAPQPGHICGVDFGTGLVSADRTGLICIGEPDMYDHISVVRARDPIQVIGCVTQSIGAYNASQKQFGSGKIKIQYRDNTDENRRKVAIDPKSGEEYEIKVWNSWNKMFPAGSLVRCVDTMGVGLMVTNEEENKLCQSPSSSDSSESSDSSASTSSESQSSGSASSGSASGSSGPSGSVPSQSSESSGPSSGSASSGSDSSGSEGSEPSTSEPSDSQPSEPSEPSQPSADCADSVGGVNIRDLPGWNAAKRQVLGHDPGTACLCWFDVDECANSSGGDNDIQL